MKIVLTISTVVVNSPSGHRSASSTNGSATPACDQQARVRLRLPRAVEVPGLEQAQELGVVDLEHVDLAAGVVRAEALVVQPRSERDVLRVPEPRHGDLLADEVVGRGDARRPCARRTTRRRR